MRILRKITDDFWWDVARKCDYATFYHTPIWRDLAVRSFPGIYRDETFGAILPTGVCVVFPMISSRRLGPLRWLMSTFEGCYGGYIADGPVSPNEAVRIYKHVCSCSAYTFHMLDNPLAPPLPDELTSRFTCVVNEVTYTLKLDEDFDSIFARFSRTQRNSYRKGLKNGVQIRLANSLDDYQAYYTTYRDAVCRWGESESYGYQWSLFEQLYNLSQIYPTNIKLWLMIFNDQIVGGRFVFYWGLQATGWNGTAHRDFLKYDVMPVSDTEIIRDAISQGYTYFDFNTSGLNEGVISYKQRYNPEGIPINVWRFENSILKPIQSVYWQLTARPYKSKSAKQRAPQSNYHGKVLESK